MILKIRMNNEESLFDFKAYKYQDTFVVGNRHADQPQTRQPGNIPTPIQLAGIPQGTKGNLTANHAELGICVKKIHITQN